jgi:fructose-1,6-bisphosphatase I
MIGTTVTQFLIEEQRNYPTATGDLTLVINDIVTACKTIASAMRFGALSEGDVLGVTGDDNVHGDTQKTLDILANQLFLARTEFGGHLAGMVSEEMESIYHLPDHLPKGRYLLLYDPVDGSSNINDNAAIGTIFSILRRPEEATGRPRIEEFLQPGIRQVCAGYAIYGPSCMLVLTTGNGVNGFTLDPSLGEFILTHPAMTIPQGGSRFFANMAAFDDWEPPVRRYVEDLMKAEFGPMGREFALRWSACAVADVHRLLMSGGVYLNPTTARQRASGHGGKLRLLYEVNPLAWIVEQAGGSASNGEGRSIEIRPTSIHQRAAAFFGDRDEIAVLLAEYLKVEG